ncbi:MAG: alpha/beta hydrolase [Thermoleophilaceae bacterium]|nr:alpha/beta hydrolase [Thermoleophilaceae bacterium]
MTTPSLPLLLPIWLEGRAGLELAELMSSPLFYGASVRDGGGSPVLLVPGFLLGDDSLGLMTSWLRRTGYRTESSGLVYNVDCSEASVRRVADRVERLAERAGRRVAIVGQSRGGLYARVLAVRRPDLVAGIVTLGSPVMVPAAVHPVMVAQAAAIASLGLFQAPGVLSWQCVDGACCRSFWADLAAPFPDTVGYESIYSRTDGIVDWHACLDPAAAHREVDSSHYGMSVNVAVYELIAAALASFPASAG